MARADSVAHPGTVANPDAILIILDGMTRVIGAMAGVFGFLGKLILGALVVLSVMGLSLATALFFTARGLHAQQEWARAAAGVLMLGLFGWSLL